MKTSTIGEILKEERQNHRLSLENLAKKTRIRVKYLRALEASQFEKLPAATFVKGYIRTYGQLFGFDYQPLVALLRRDYRESAKGKLVPREFMKPVLKRRQFFKPATLIVTGLAVVFLTLISYVGLQWHQLNQPPALMISFPAENSLVAPRVNIEGQTDADAIVTINSQPVALQTDGSFQTEIFLSREGLNTISIEAQDRQGKSNLVQRTVRVKF